MKGLLFLASLSVTFYSHSQTKFDTLSAIGVAFNKSKMNLSDLVYHDDARQKDVIFVMAKSVSPNRELNREVDFDSLTVVVAPELALFHFRVRMFVVITKVKVGRKKSSKSSVYDKRRIQ